MRLTQDIQTVCVCGIVFVLVCLWYCVCGIVFVCLW